MAKRMAHHVLRLVRMETDAFGVPQEISRTAARGENGRVIAIHQRAERRACARI